MHLQRFQARQSALAQTALRMRAGGFFLSGLVNLSPLNDINTVLQTVCGFAAGSTVSTALGREHGQFERLGARGSSFAMTPRNQKSEVLYTRRATCLQTVRGLSAPTLVYAACV
jgi:hypothetical protein